MKKNFAKNKNSRNRSFKKSEKFKKKEIKIFGKVDRPKRGIAFFVPLNKECEDIFIPKSQVHKFGDGDIVEAKIVEENSKLYIRELRLVQKKKRFVLAKVKKNNASFIWEKFEFEAKVKNWQDGFWFCYVSAFSERLNEPLEIEKEEFLGENLQNHEIDYYRTIAKYGLDPKPYIAVAEEPNYEVPTFDSLKGEKSKRQDLTNIPFVTIDGETARDHDDAVFVEKMGEGFRLYVAIADVAHYVRPQSKIDKEAFKRGNSVYFPHTFIPMLPHKLTKDVCSLTEGHLKFAMVAVIDYDKLGNRIFYKIKEALVKPHTLTTYNQFIKDLENNENYKKSFELYKLLQEVRKKRGALFLDFPSTEVLVNDNGETEKIVKRNRIASEEMVEEFMLEANTVVAEFLHRHKTGVYRVHEEPDEISLAESLKFARAFGITGLTPQEVIKNAEGKSFAPSISMKILRSLKVAKYTIQNDGHYGLALTDYTHFTSPIRRYSDLIVHRLLKALIYQGKIPKSIELEEIANQCSYTERNAEEAEREVIKHRKLRELEKMLGEQKSGKIVSLTDRNMWVELDEMPVDGAVPVERLPGDMYVYDERTFTLRERRGKRMFRIADKVDIIISKVNILDLIAEFDLVETTKSKNMKDNNEKDSDEAL